MKNPFIDQAIYTNYDPLASLPCNVSCNKPAQTSLEETAESAPKTLNRHVSVVPLPISRSKIRFLPRSPS